jgi:hypothetical protein
MSTFEYNPLNRYKVSTFTATETVGDKVIDGNMISSGTLTITPDDGYVISASDFSVANLSDLTTAVLDDGTDNPNYAWIQSVAFTDTTTAGQVGNLVTVTVNLVSGGPRGSFELTGNTTIKLDIDGKVEEPPIDIIDYVFDFSISLPDFSNVILTPVTGVNINGLSQATEINNNATLAISGQTNVSENTNIATLVVNADTGYQIDNQPYLAYNNMDTNLVTLDFVSMQANSPVTSYTFNVMFKSSVEVKENKSSYAELKYNISQIPEIKREIVDIAHGETNISVLGETRPIEIFGDSEADFDVTINRVSDGASIINTTITNSSVLSPDQGSVNSINKKLESGGGIKSFKFDQAFPANPDVLSTTVKTTQTSTTMALNGTSPTSSLRVGDILVYDAITSMANIAGGGINEPVTIVSITDADEIVLSANLIQASGETVKFRRDEKYDINIYPKPGSTLNSSLPSSKPHFRLTQHPKPKLTIIPLASTNYTFPSDSKVVFESSPGAKKNKLREGKGAVGGTSSTNLNNDLFTCTFVATRSSGTFSSVDVPVWSSKTRFNNDSTNDFAFQARSIDGVDSLSFIPSEAGYDIEIFNCNASLNGASTVATITFDVLIKKFGDFNSSIVLVSSQFLHS